VCEFGFDGEMLKRIQAGPKTIDFGSVFVNSESKQHFYIKNELKGAISARLQITHENVHQSYQKPQIILSGQDAGFMVDFKSSNTGTFSHIISYIINEKHTFKFMVKAEVVAVNLELSTSMITLKFGDESLDMETSQEIKVKNPGNSNAYFTWFSPNPSLRVEPVEGFAEPYSSAICNVIYKPQGGRSNEEDTLDMKIRDGEPKTLRVVASANETRCEATPNTINFGCLAVAQKSTINIFVKNTNPKWSAIYRIDTDSLPPNLEIKPLKGRVLPENSEKLEISYCAKNNEEIKDRDFQIKIRGSKTLQVPVSAKTIIPKLVIYENEFDFGTVTYGSNSTLNMTLENSSPINAILNLDLRESESNPDSEGYSCLKLKQIRSSDDETLIIDEKDSEEILKEEKVYKLDEQHDPNMRSVDLSDDEHEGSDESFVEQNDDKSNYFVLTLKPNRVYHFELNYTPLQPRHYKFRLPLSLAGYGKLDSLAIP